MSSITRINRDDMLELTRRMTIARTSMTRIAGSYMDADGFIDGTFNTNFLKLKNSEKEKNLTIAKAIPFAQTNQNLKRYKIPKEAYALGGIRQLLLGIKSCALKNDALLESFYDYIAENYHTNHDYAVYLSSIILMISLSKQPITKASGNPKKSTNISSVQSVRFPVIMNLVNQNVVSFFRHLIPEQKIRTTLISTKVIRIFPKKTY